MAECQADFPLIEKFVFDYLLLGKAAAMKARRRFSFAPLPLLFTSAEKIATNLAVEIRTLLDLGELVVEHFELPGDQYKCREER